MAASLQNRRRRSPQAEELTLCGARPAPFFFGDAMFLAFVILLLLNVVIGFVVWLCWSRVTAHMRDDPEAAKLVSEHVIAPLLTGKKKEEKP